MEVHAVPKQKDPDGFVFSSFCLQYVAQTYGKEADTWFGSDLDPVIFAQFLLVFISICLEYQMGGVYHTS